MKRKNNFISIIILLMVLVLFIGFVLEKKVKKFVHIFSAEFSTDYMPMYGKKDYQDYIDSLNFQEKTDHSKNIQYAITKWGTKEKAQSRFSNAGWKKMNESNNQSKFLDAVPIFNFAWALDPENFNVYWNFGAVLGNLFSQYHDPSMLQQSNMFFEQALSKFDVKKVGGPYDQISLLCDFAWSLSLSTNQVDQKRFIQIVEKATTIHVDGSDQEKALRNKCFEAKNNLK